MSEACNKVVSGRMGNMRACRQEVFQEFKGYIDNSRCVNNKHVSNIESSRMSIGANNRLPSNGRCMAPLHANGFTYMTHIHTDNWFVHFYKSAPSCEAFV